MTTPARKNWTTRTLLKRLGERLEEMGWTDDGAEAIRRPEESTALTDNTAAQLITELRELAFEEAGL